MSERERPEGERSELENFSIVGETAIGWDAKTAPNETVDEEGRIVPSGGFGIHDPRAPSRRVYDDPEVVAMREEFRAKNGWKGIEICAPHELKRIARIFRRDGYVVVKDLLDTETLERFREGCTRVLRDILAIPGFEGRKYITETGRLPHRYSYGTASASRHMMHDPVWASMIDLPTTTPILTEIMGSPDYFVSGGGGDLALPGAIEMQHLHTDGIDMGANSDVRLDYARSVGLVDIPDDKAFADLDFRTQRLVIERTPPSMTINFVMTDLTWENGPIRQIPGTHATVASPPKPEDEPDWMRFAALVGAPAGSGVFRDHRAWHSGTPNLSKEIRCLPNLEFVPPWHDERHFMKSMPHDIWETLTPHGQQICRHIKQDSGVWPFGAGVMHPLAGGRKAAHKASKEAQRN